MGTQGTLPSSAPASAWEAADPDVRSVLDSVRRIVRDLRLASRAAEKAVGLSAAQLFVLHKLAEAPALSVNDLAERTSTDQSSVSVVVRRLVDARLIRRQQSGEDGRRVELSLTAKARALLEKAPTAAQERLIGALCRMSAGSRRQLARLLETLVHDLGIDVGDAGMLFEDETDKGSAPRSRQGRKSRAADSDHSTHSTHASPKAQASQGRNQRNGRSG